MKIYQIYWRLKNKLKNNLETKDAQICDLERDYSTLKDEFNSTNEEFKEYWFNID